jgi:hypothetical protein
MEDSPLDMFRLALPPYLSNEGKRDLVAKLLRYPNTTDYFGRAPDESEPVQGDAWHGLTIVDFVSGEREAILGFVVSNSCDIAAANDPTPDQNVVFAPVMDLELYLQFLQKSGKAETQVTATASAIRKQQIHRIFYLPSMHGVMGESIVALDSLHAQPLHSLSEAKSKRVFSLSNFGWYMLLFKLSLHFMRMDEQVRRAELTAA